MSQTPQKAPKKRKPIYTRTPVIVALITTAGVIIVAIITLQANTGKSQVPTPTAVLLSPTPIPTATPDTQATVNAENAQATGTAEAHAHATATAVAQSRPTTPQQTLQTLCNAAVRADYLTQWNQYDYTYASGNWGNESMYAADLKDRDGSHKGVANCTVTNVTQNGTSASGTTKTTFGDGTTDTVLFFLTKETDGVWRITGLQH